uniref:Exportin 1 (CRM1 homolog, yeast) a n=1 Tax=Neogobius melanostomus TaxID=47308 RepID=A0A8C6TRN8_9GOBI
MPAEMTMLADHPARQLLDFNQKLDINLLDNVVNSMYHDIGSQQRVAQEVLTNLKDHPDAWTRVDTILEFSQNMKTKVPPKYQPLLPWPIRGWFDHKNLLRSCCR